nr:reverse transcriptase domain-containing protein [Tanacetum cinerariifolium]
MTKPYSSHRFIANCFIAGNFKKEVKDALWAFRTAYKPPIGCTPYKLVYEKTKKLHDSKIKNRIFNVGDRVLLFNSRLKIFSGKLKTHWSGPFTITKAFPYGTVELSQPEGPNFKTLNKKGKFGEIKVDSKQMMKTEGVESVRFKLHDGSVKTALNMKYVLGAARNILSLGVLTSRGYRYVGRKDTCKVYKKDQIVIRGRKVANNLCYLEGKALQGMTFCGGNKGKKKIKKRVYFLDKDEVLGILSQGRIY